LADVSPGVAGGGFVGLLIALLVIVGEALKARNARRIKQAYESTRPAPAPALPVLPLPPPARPSMSREVDLSAVRIQLSRALLELDERDSALRRVRATAEEDIRRQRATIDQLEAELRRSAAALTEERGRAEALDQERAQLMRQIQGGTYARTLDPGTSGAATRGDATGHRRSVRRTDIDRLGVRQESVERPFQADRDKAER
jgi:hypothetical protein